MLFIILQNIITSAFSRKTRRNLKKHEFDFEEKTVKMYYLQIRVQKQHCILLKNIKENKYVA